MKSNSEKAKECANEINRIAIENEDIVSDAWLTKIIIRHFPEPQEKVCSWVENDCGIYETDCKEAFQFEAGQRHDNRFKFCPYCGGKIV